MVKPNLKNAAKAAGRVVKAVATGKPALVTDKVLEARLAVCAGCDFLDPESRQCRKCTCFVDIKANLTTETCPESFWKE